MPKKNEKPSDEYLRELIVNRRMKLSDIGKMFNVRHSTISNWKKALDIPGGIIIPFGKDDLEFHYHGCGRTQSEIAEIYGVTQTTISRYMIEWNVETIGIDDRREITDPVELTELQDDLVRGTILGDAHLRRSPETSPGKNSMWVVEHGDRQRRYLEHCATVLRPYVQRQPYRYWRVDSRFKAGGTWSNGIYSTSHKFWTRLRDEWYPNGIKVLPESQLQRLTARSLAYWYADDGTRMGKAANLYLNGFTKDETARTKEFLFDRFSLNCEMKRFADKDQHFLYFARTKCPALMEIIAPVLANIPDMEKKIVPTE